MRITTLGTLLTENSECLRSLHFEGMTDKYDTLAPEHDGTLEWVWDKNSLAFAQWLRSGQGVYWITGRPGSGKSTLMKYLVKNDERLKAQLGESLFIIKYFFDFRASSTAKSIEGLLRSLIWQLLRSCKASFESVISVYQDMKSFHSYIAWTRPVLELLISNLVDSFKDTKILVFIDGLDEFGGSDVDIAAFLDDLARRGSAHMRFCLASRPYPDFAFQFADCLRLRLHEQTSDDIDIYLQERLSTLRDMSDLDVPYLVTTIRARAEGVFLWVKLVCEEIQIGWRRFDTFSELLRRIDQMPTDLKDLYRRIFDNLSEGEREQAYRMLALITYAMRPLTSLEFCYALAYSYEASIRLGHQPCSCVLCRNRAGMRDFIASLQSKLSAGTVSQDLEYTITGRIHAVCRGLIDVHSGHPCFLHETVSAFWPEMQRLDLASSNYGSSATSGIYLLLAACTEFLAAAFQDNWPVFTTQTAPFELLLITSVSRRPPATFPSSETLIDIKANAFQLVLLDYALKYWLDHVRVGTAESEDAGRLILSRLSGQAFEISSYLTQRLSTGRRNLRPATMLEMAIGLELEKYVRAELQSLFSVPRSVTNLPHSQSHAPSVRRTNSNHGRFLFAIAQWGNSQLAGFLLDCLNRANLSPYSHLSLPDVDEYSKFALHRAIFFGHIPIVEILLRNGADPTVGSKSSNFTEWLWLGSTLELDGEHDRAPLPPKSQHINRLAETKWVQEVLGTSIRDQLHGRSRLWGPTIASAYEWANTPLELAIRCNYNVRHDSFTALLSTFPRRSRHPSLGNALTAAAFHGLTCYVEQLLAFGADPNFTSSSTTLCVVTGKHMCSPLISAICNGHFRVVDLVLTFGGDPNKIICCPCGPHLSPLETALRCWDTAEDDRLYLEHALSYIICLLYQKGGRVREQSTSLFSNEFPDVFQNISEVELQEQLVELEHILDEEYDDTWPRKRAPSEIILTG